MLLFVHLMAGLSAGVFAAVLAHQAGFSTGIVVGCYVLAGMAALATGAAVEKWAETARVRRAERRAPADGAR